MKTEKLHQLISAILCDILKDTQDVLEYSIKNIPHNGAEVQLSYIFKDDTAKRGLNSVPCADPVKVYAIEGADNIRKKLEAIRGAMA